MGNLQRMNSLLGVQKSDSTISPSYCCGNFPIVTPDTTYKYGVDYYNLNAQITRSQSFYSLSEQYHFEMANPAELSHDRVPEVLIETPKVPLRTLLRQNPYVLGLACVSILRHFSWRRSC